MRKHWFILIVALLSLAAGAFGATQLVRARVTGPPMGPPPEPPPGLGMLQDYLELTPEQRTAMAEIDEKYADTRPALRDKVDAARNKLADVIRDPESTKDQAVVAVKDLGNAMNAMHVNSIEYSYQLRKHLTRQQRKRMTDLMDRGIRCNPACPGMGQGRGNGGSGAAGMGPKGCRRGMLGSGNQTQQGGTQQ